MPRRGRTEIKMKLILAIVNNDDSAVVAGALSREYFTVTKLSTTGGFLMVGNTTLLIGTPNDRVDRAIEILRENSSTRTKEAQPLGTGLKDSSLPDTVEVRGATVFVLDVERHIKF